MADRMASRILLVTTSSDRWIKLFHDIASEGEDDLTILRPTHVIREVGEQCDIAFVDSTSVLEMKHTVAELRSLFPTKRIVVLTAAPEWHEAREAYRAGANDYRPKSYNADELRKMIKSSKRSTTGGNQTGWHTEESNG